MAHGFVAFVDEAGDEGFTFRDPPERGSSEWFLLSALIIRERRRVEEMQSLRSCMGAHYKSHWSNLHFRELRHEQRAAITYYLAHRPFRVITVCWNKRQIHEDGKRHTLADKSKLHHYAVRYLVERISWLAWDFRESNHPTPTKLVFSKCKNLTYANLNSYLQYLKTQNTEVRWPWVDVDRIVVRSPSELIGLKGADCVVSGMRAGLELNRHQLCISDYCRHLQRITYEHNGKQLQYGLKIMPAIPDPEPQRDNRYGWIELYK